MDKRLGELRSSPDEGAVRGGERQARAAFRLVSRDPTIRRLMAIEALALTGLWVAFLLLARQTGSADRDGEGVLEQWLYWASAMGIATVGSVAFACAVDAKIDGAEIDLRMAFDEVRGRLPAVLCWWLISMAVWAGLGYGASAVMAALPALLVASVIWGVSTLFIVPAIALQDGGPLAPLGEAPRLLRARWGRALVGLFAIGFLFGIAIIATGYLLLAAARSHPHGTDASLWRIGGPLLLLYLVYALMAATREAFAVILARDALGDLPGEPPTVTPRRRGVVVARRVAFGAFVLAVGLIVAAALFGHHDSNNGPTATVRYVPPSPAPRPVTYSTVTFDTTIRDPRARQLRRDAPVMLKGGTIGQVALTHDDGPSGVEVFFLAPSRFEDTVLGSRKKVAVRHGRASLVIVPR